MSGKTAVTCFTCVMLVLTLCGGLWKTPLTWPAVGLYAVVLVAYTSGSVAKRVTKLVGGLFGPQYSSVPQREVVEAYGVSA